MATCAKNPFAKMRHRVTLQAITRSTDGQGGYTETWGNVADLWASIEPVKGWEKYQAAQTETPITHNITMRYRSGVTTAQRLLYGMRVFDIKECLNEGEDNALLKIKAMERADPAAAEWQGIEPEWESINDNWEDIG